MVSHFVSIFPCSKLRISRSNNPSLPHPRYPLLRRSRCPHRRLPLHLRLRPRRRHPRQHPLEASLPTLRHPSPRPRPLHSCRLHPRLYLLRFDLRIQRIYRRRNNLLVSLLRNSHPSLPHPWSSCRSPLHILFGKIWLLH